MRPSEKLFFQFHNTGLEFSVDFLVLDVSFIEHGFNLGSITLASLNKLLSGSLLLFEPVVDPVFECVDLLNKVVVD